jgi:ATP-binding protein involved in chromosome partitioning
MSAFVCSECDTAHDIFDTGGGDKLAAEFDLPLLGRLPLDPSIRESGENGTPTVREDDGEASSAFTELAENTMDGLGEIRRRSHRHAIKQAATVQRRTSSSR